MGLVTKPASKNPAWKIHSKVKERAVHSAAHRTTHPEPRRGTPAGRSVKATLQHTNTLTHPQVVHLLAHAAVLFRDLLEVLVEAGLQRQEARQRGEVWLCDQSAVSGYVSSSLLCLYLSCMSWMCVICVPAIIISCNSQSCLQPRLQSAFFS